MATALGALLYVRAAFAESCQHRRLVFCLAFLQHRASLLLLSCVVQSLALRFSHHSLGWQRQGHSGLRAMEPPSQKCSCTKDFNCLQLCGYSQQWLSGVSKPSVVECTQHEISHSRKKRIQS